MSYQSHSIKSWNLMSITLYQFVKPQVISIDNLQRDIQNFRISKFIFKMNFKTSIITSFSGWANSSLGKVYVFCGYCCWWCSFWEWFSVHILRSVTMFALRFLCLLQEICWGWEWNVFCVWFSFHYGNPFQRCCWLAARKHIKPKQPHSRVFLES